MVLSSKLFNQFHQKMDNHEEHNKKQRHKNSQAFKVTPGESLYVFSSNGCIRQSIIALVKHSYFENLSLSLIMLFSLMLRFNLDSQITETYTMNTVIWLEAFVSFLFVIEVILRVIAMGLLNYLRNCMNIIDLILVITIMASFLFELMYLDLVDK